jgi:putative flippase GtrA
VFWYSIFAVLIYVGFHYAVATLLSTILGVLFNFKKVGVLVFKNGKGKLIVKFIAVYAVMYCLNIMLLKIFSLWDVNIYVAGLALLFPIAVTAFLLNKHVVFNEKAVDLSIR